MPGYSGRMTEERVSIAISLSRPVDSPPCSSTQSEGNCTSDVHEDIQRTSVLLGHLQVGVDMELDWTTLNPFTAPTCKISRLKDAQTRLETVYFPGPITPTFNAVHFDDVLSHASAQKRKLKFKISHFHWPF